MALAKAVGIAAGITKLTRECASRHWVMAESAAASRALNAKRRAVLAVTSSHCSGSSAWGAG